MSMLRVRRKPQNADVTSYIHFRMKTKGEERWLYWNQSLCHPILQLYRTVGID